MYLIIDIYTHYLYDLTMGRIKRNYSNHTLKATKLFAAQIKLARKKHHWSETELAERAGISRPTVRNIEQGNPATELGLYFEVATLLGVTLFHEDSSKLTAIQKDLDLQLALLPKRIDSDTSEVFDDF